MHHRRRQAVVLVRYRQRLTHHLRQRRPAHRQPSLRHRAATARAPLTRFPRRQVPSGVKEKSSSVPPTSAATGAARQDKTGDSKTGDSKSGDSKSGAPPSASKPASSAARAPAPKRSGGGFVSTLSHLAAGIVGGGIALFAAEPVGKQFGFALSSAAAGSSGIGAAPGGP